MIKEFIGTFSSHIKYWKAVHCPCTTPQTGQPNIACHICRGLGWSYLSSQTDPIYQSAQVHSRNSKKLSQAGGQVVQGTSSITFRPGIIPGDGDLVQICADREVINDEYHVVGAVLTDGSTAETLRFKDVACIENVIVRDAVTKNISQLTQDQYSFDPAARRIMTQLPIGSQYSIRYQAVPEYILIGETSRPLLRVTHDDNLNDPYRTGGSKGIDVVYPYNVLATRLDRAIVQRQRGAIDGATQSTFNTPAGRGPWR